MGSRRFLAISTMFVTVVAAGDMPCPDVCTCPSPYRADCCNSSLTHIPRNLVSDVMFLNASSNNFHALRKRSFSVHHIKILDFSNNRISVIEKDALAELEDLIFLYLGRNRIVFVDQDVFRMNHRIEFLKLDNNVLDLPVGRPFLNIPSLSSLDMSSCNISSLPEKTFVKMSSLKELRLTYNRLQTLDPQVFLPLKSLKSLYLSGNLLRTLHKDLFVMLKELVVLDLSNNELQTLHPQVFTFLESVELLELSGNQLETLGVDVFTPLKSLKRLHLHKNTLNTLNRKQFSELYNLAVLDLSGNHLDNLQLHVICHLNNLTYFKVSDNWLACNCGLWELWKWSVEEEVRIVSTCEEPDFEFSAKNFESLQYNKSCNATLCGVEIETNFPEQIISSVYVYVIICVGLMLVLIACVITTCVVFRYREKFCKKRNIQVSAIECSQIRNTFSAIQHDDYIAHVQHQQELQKELHRQHQETLLRNHVQREQSQSLKALPIVKHQNIRHSCYEYHLSSFADNEREWSNADTLPSNKRSSVYLTSMSSHPIKPEPSKTPRDFSASEPKLKDYPNNLSVCNETSSDIYINPLSSSSWKCETPIEEPKFESVHDLSPSGSESVTHERLKCPREI
jgi:Leucine-rich repeat (LRR) protein